MDGSAYLWKPRGAPHPTFIERNEEQAPTIGKSSFPDSSQGLSGCRQQLLASSGRCSKPPENAVLTELMAERTDGKEKLIDLLGQ